MACRSPSNMSPRRAIADLATEDLRFLTSFSTATITECNWLWNSSGWQWTNLDIRFKPSIFTSLWSKKQNYFMKIGKILLYFQNISKFSKYQIFTTFRNGILFHWNCSFQPMLSYIKLNQSKKKQQQQQNKQTNPRVTCI